MKPTTKQEIIHSFNKAASFYESHAFVQKEIGKRLLSRLDFLNLKFDTILDAGCGTGLLMQDLKKRFPKSLLIGIDIAQDMLKQAKKKKASFLQKKSHLLHADIEKLPFKENQFDLVFSNLVLHWGDFNQCLSRLEHVLKPGGMILFTLPGPDTLTELMSAFQRVDPFAHINHFNDMHDYGDLLQQHKFQNVVMDMEKITFEYTSLWQLLKDLKYTGVRNINPNRCQHLTPRSHFDKLIEAYPTIENKYPVTFEVIFGHAICPSHKKAKQFNIPLTLVDQPIS